MLCSLVDQAPNDVIDGAVEQIHSRSTQANLQQIHAGRSTANPHRQIHSKSTQGTRVRGLEILIDKQGKIQHCRESWKV